MIRLRPLVFLALAASFSACSDKGGTTPAPTVQRIVVTPDGSSVTTLGASAQFTAQAQTEAGVPVSGINFTWSSSNLSVATVDATGRAVSVGFGEAQITASAEGLSAGATFSVRDCSLSVNLQPGEWVAQAVPAAGDCGVILPAGAAGDRYRVAVVRPASEPVGFAPADITVQVSPLGTSLAAAPVAAPRAISEARRPVRLNVPGLEEAARIAERTARAHTDLRLRERELIRRLGPENVARPGPFSVQGPQPVDLPQTLQIDPTTPTSCTPAGTKVTAVKVWENDRFGFFQDQAQAQTALAVTPTQVQRMADFYEAHGKPVIDAYFDGTPDIDNNGKVIVFITPVVASGTAAFVWSGDFFTKASCPASNEGEYIFFSATLIQAQDDPDGANWQSLETIVHEMKHVSSLYNSVNRPLSFADPYHPSWEEEGAAEVAGNMASRVAWATVGGPSANETVTEQMIVETGFEPNNGPIKPEFYGIALRMLRTQGFLSSQPNGVVATPVGAGSDHSVYGSGWTFHRWLGDAYGNAASAPLADAPLFKQLNASETAPGILGLEAVTGSSFPRLMEEFAAAVMFNSTDAPSGPRRFTSYIFTETVEIFCFAADNPPCDGAGPGPTGAWPWPVTTKSDGTPSRGLQEAATYSGRIGNGGLRIHDLVSDGTGIGAELIITAPSQTRIVVARLSSVSGG